VSCDEDLPASLADAAALDSRRNLKPGRQKSLQVPQGHLLGCCGGRSSRTAHPSGRAPNSEAGLVFTIPGVDHLLSVALDTTSRSTLSDGRSVRKFVPFGTGIGLCQPFGRQTHAGLYPAPLRGADASAGIGLALRAQTCRSSGVDTTHRPGGSRALSSSRATRFPNPSDFLVRGSPPLQWCRDD